MAIAAGSVGAEDFLNHPGRFNSMHLQDIDMNAPLPPPAVERRLPRRPQVAVGKETIDWARTLQTAMTAGVQRYFVEQNWELTQQGVAFLKTLAV